MSENYDPIVISAFGAVTPLGSSYQEIEQSLRMGLSGIREIKKYNTDTFKSKFAGLPSIGNEKVRWPHKGAPVVTDILYAQHAIENLLSHSGYGLDSYDPDRIGCFLGVDEPVVDPVQKAKCVMDEDYIHNGQKEDHRIAERYFRVNDFLRYSPCHSLKLVHEATSFTGPSFCHIGLCSASLQAIGTGFQAIRDDRVDAVVVGGISAKIGPEHYIGLEAADVICTDSAIEPQQRSRPFDQRRSGYIPSEGAILFTLERKSAVEKRSAQPLLEILGYGSSLNASHIVKPDESSIEMILTMQRAIKDSGLTADDIDVVNAHGTSTKLNDLQESQAINQVFGRPLPVTANKSLHGHLIAAAGAMETLNTLISSQEGFVPKTINLVQQDPDCQVNVVKETLDMSQQTVLKNSFGMGGLAASIVYRSC